jgi:hypothetical protein
MNLVIPLGMDVAKVVLIQEVIADDEALLAPTEGDVVRAGTSLQIQSFDQLGPFGI